MPKKKNINPFESLEDQNSKTRDIKTSLRQAKLPNGEPCLLDDDENNVAVLIEQARNELGRGNAATAKFYLDEALEIDDEEPLVLIERGRCYVKLSTPHLALKDVDPVLKDNPTNPLALFVKAEALYHLGDFEHALMYYQRALRYSTQDPEKLRLGIRRSEKAINNAIGKSMSHYFSGLSDILDQLEDNVLETPLAELRKLPGEEEKITKAEVEDRRAFLGPLYKEVEYLAKLEGCATKVGLKRVAREARGGIAFLGEREEFWRQQSPLYK